MEEIEELDDGDAGGPVGSGKAELTSQASDKGAIAPATTNTHQHNHKGHKHTASEDGMITGTRRGSIGHSSSVSDRESRLTSRLKSVLESRSGTK